MKTIVDFWDTALEDFNPEKMYPQTLEGSSLAVKDGHTFEIMVKSQTAYDNMFADSGNGKSVIEALSDHICERLHCDDISVEVSKLGKDEPVRASDIRERVDMNIENDVRKDDV